jgi:hypothetical protein
VHHASLGFELRERTIMNKRSNFATGGVASALVCTLILACTSSSSTPTANSTTPIGATAVVDAGLIGCANLEDGCFTFNGAYSAPAVTATCASPGGAVTGVADTHCVGVPPQTVNPLSCGVTDAGPGDDDSDGGAAGDAGAAPAGPCGENGPDYGATMYGTEGKDDDCKYDVTYSAAPICENDGTYLVVKATSLSEPGTPVTGACTFAELCLNDTHPAPSIDSRPPSGKQEVVEGPPGTYTIGPVLFDAPGQWTVRFHFNELCCDVADDSPHGHAAFFLNVP